MFFHSVRKKIFFYVDYMSLGRLLTGIFLLVCIFVPRVVSAASLTPPNIIELINVEREKFGLSLLTPNPLLEKAADEKGQAIFSEQKFTHNFGDRRFSQWIKDQNYQYSIVGENLAINFTASEPLFNAWLASPAHKKNIMHNDYREIGVSVQSGEWFGEETMIAVAIFAAPAVAAEQTVPSSPASQQTVPMSLLPEQFLSSNLSDNYLTSIAPLHTDENINRVAAVTLPAAFNKNKTAFQIYILLAVRLMIVYMSTMLLVMLAYLYSQSLATLNKKLTLLHKPQRN